MVPGAACRPLVGPIMVRATETASGPSATMATTGPDAMNASGRVEEFAGQPPLHGVGLNEDQSAFGHRIQPFRHRDVLYSKHEARMSKEARSSKHETKTRAWQLGFDISDFV